MTRTAVAYAHQDYSENYRANGANIIDLKAYRNQVAISSGDLSGVMESRRYVLVPVVETAPYTPRPRRDHHRAERLNLIHTVLNLAVIGATALLTSGLLGVI